RDELVLRVHEVEPGRVQLDVAEHNDLEMWFQNVGEKCLIHPRAADGSTRVGDYRVEDSKPASSRDRQVGCLDLAQYGRLCAGAQRGDRLHTAPVFVAKRKPVQQVFDGDKACTFEIGRFTRTDPLQELKRSG